MKYCLRWVVFVIVCRISFSQPLENDCNLRPCLKRSYSKVLPLNNITCVKRQPCTISERNSSCSAFQEESYALSLKNVEFHHNDEGLSIQLVLSSSYLFHIYPKGTQASFVVRVHLNENEYCHNFTIPAYLIKEYSFSLPCIHVSSEQKETLQLFMEVYYQASDKEIGELVSKQAALYYLNNIPSVRSVKSKHLRLKGHFDEQSFHLTFNTKCSFLYNVSIHEASGKELCSTTGIPICSKVHLRSLQSSIDCDLSLFKPCQLYCIRTSFILRGSCSYIYPKRSTEISYFQRLADDKNINFKSSLCKNWNASVVLVNNSIEETISVKVSFKSGLEKYAYCFHCYEVQLLRLFTQPSNSYCHPSKGMVIGNKEVHLKNGQGEASFSNLSNGNFCALILPCMNYIHKAITLSSSIVSINHEPKKELKYPQSQNFPLETLIASMIILSFVGCGVLWYVRSVLAHKEKKCEKEMGIKERMIKPVAEVVPLMPRKIPVHVFDSWNDTSSLPSDFKDFLKTCAQFEVIDDMVKRYLENKGTWTKEVFVCRCFKTGDSCDSNTKYVFIHSGRFKLNNRIKSKAFKSAVDFLLTSRRKSQKDHVFVVYLDEPQYKPDSPCMGLSFWRSGRHEFQKSKPQYKDGTEDLVPSKRYDIRNNQLIDLCINLGYSESRKKELQKDLENHKIYEICKKETQENA